MSDLLDPGLAPAGAAKIDWAAAHAPVMRRMRERMIADGSVRGRRVAMILPLEAKTAFLAQILADSGAEVALTAEPAMTHDDVAAALAARGVDVFARSDATAGELHGFHLAVLAMRPEIVVDDMAELIRLAHTSEKAALDHLTGATEQTTSGVVALRAMDAAAALRVPCIAANDAKCKHLFDNRYGSGQSVLGALMDTTNLLVAGTVFLVVGYGFVGRGVAGAARGLGARVVVAEVDPVAALEAYHDGFDVATVAQGCERADWIVTATGCRHALPFDAIARCRDGAVLANAGGPPDEIDVDALVAAGGPGDEVRPKVFEHTAGEGRRVFLVGGGRCVNLAAGEGHPIEIMDLTFAVQGLATRHLALHAPEMAPGLHALPPAIDDEIAREKLADLGLHVDTLTPAQQEFLTAWD